MYIAKYTTTKVATVNHLNDLNTDSIGQESQQSSNKLSFTFNNVNPLTISTTYLVLYFTQYSKPAEPFILYFNKLEVLQKTTCFLLS